MQVTGTPQSIFLQTEKSDWKPKFIYYFQPGKGYLGAYSTMIDRITSSDNPDLFVMQYSTDFQVVNLTLIPKFFFTPSIIEKRKPLSANAKRAGWIGCNILYSDIPKQGKIAIINRQKLSDVKTVTEEYSKIKKL